MIGQLEHDLGCIRVLCIVLDGVAVFAESIHQFGERFSVALSLDRVVGLVVKAEALEDTVHVSADLPEQWDLNLTDRLFDVDISFINDLEEFVDGLGRVKTVAKGFMDCDLLSLQGVVKVMVVLLPLLHSRLHIGGIEHGLHVHEELIELLFLPDTLLETVFDRVIHRRVPLVKQEEEAHLLWFVIVQDSLYGDIVLERLAHF